LAITPAPEQTGPPVQLTPHTETPEDLQDYLQANPASQVRCLLKAVYQKPQRAQMVQAMVPAEAAALRLDI
jgi:hypothetical protein